MTLRCENTPLYKFIGGTMKGIDRQKQILSIVSKCVEEYDNNLINKKVMLILENKDKTIGKEEVYFPKSSFYHLTDTRIKEKNGRELNSYEVYDKIRDNKITLNQYIIESKDKTTDLKLQVLPQLMRIDRMANMLGDFTNYNMFLQTEKIAGSVNACMGFIKDTKLNTYVPNTALKKDIRDITNNRSKIIAILKKDITENLYRNITYLKNNYQIEDILKNKEISKIIDADKIYSADKSVDKKILNYIYANERTVEENIEKDEINDVLSRNLTNDEVIKEDIN